MAASPGKMDPELGNGEVQTQETEADPCLPLAAPAPDPLPNANTPKKKLTLSKQNGRTVWPGSELEGVMRKKFGLNREGFLLCVVGWVLLLLFLVVILVMIVLWPRSANTGLLCTKAACFRASSVILPAMDRDVDRCSNLYAYSCGGWSAMNPKPLPTRERWDQKTELRLRLAEDVRDLVATLPHQWKTSSTTWKIKQFYDSCMALDSIDRDDKTPLKRIITDLGGWHVLREFSVYSWDFQQTFVRLHATYGVNPFFTVSVVDDPYSGNRSVVEIKPPVLGLPDAHLFEHKEEKIATSYREFMKDVVQVFSATSVEANLFANEMFYFERQLSEVLPPASELSDARTHQMLTISHLQTIASAIPILEILQALLPGVNIGENTPVLVQSPRYLTSLSRILSTVDRKALNNYMIWHLVKAFLPYLGSDLQQLNSVYLRHTKGIQEPVERWEFCAESLLRFQGVALAAHLQKRYPERERMRRREELRSLFENLRWAVKDSVTKAEWVDLELYQHIVKKLDIMKMISAFTDEETSDEFLDAFYGDLLVQKNDFFRNIGYGIDFSKKLMLNQYLRPNSTFLWRDRMINPAVTYLPTINTVVVGQALLREPWFNPDYPAGLLYGGLGTEVAAAILSAILPPYGLYSHNGTLLPPTGLVANLSRSSIDRQLACLMGNSSAQGLSTFLSISSIRQSLKALRRSTSNGESSVQPGLENLTEGELLFLRYAQSQCFVQTQQDEIVDIAVTAPLRGPTLLNSIMSNLKSATDIMGCSAPATPCKHLL